MMQIYIYLTIVLLAILMALIAPWRSIRQHGTLLPSDIALPFAPPAFTLFGLAFLNDAAQVGWGAILYPAFAILPGAIILNVRAFLLAGLSVSPEKISIGLLAAAAVIAFLVGGMVPPWYD
ncbi:hypothetical protein [Herbaspirillum rubrisubalbicans]|uniref:Uncharacterized protein n=1 Tax=Herbaspirillum rubrisubalbicans TaxID=80842 RepID=A0AAD0XGX3_9BURK|nr:hypothetical protein [Herbaspirillum rubrisubalbicans]AYR24922.1 hypothetical protein RC54_14305 [Herbaspirillum rubrisubalbicans]